jgi:hypothetical protein
MADVAVKRTFPYTESEPQILLPILSEHEVPKAVESIQLIPCATALPKTLKEDPIRLKFLRERVLAR